MPLLSRLMARLRSGLPFSSQRTTSLADPIPVDARVQVLLLVEGVNDAHFLRRISAILHADHPELPDLALLERQGTILFVPFGGGDILPWTYRLAGLGRAEFFLLDRELPPVTQLRQQLAEIVNLRTKCRAVVMCKRSLENYLHPAAIREALGVTVTFTDDDSVADVVARRCQEQSGPATGWQELSVRRRRRLRDRVKKRLNTETVERMTVERLAEQDPAGEVASWLAMIADLCH